MCTCSGSPCCSAAATWLATFGGPPEARCAFSRLAARFQPPGLAVASGCPWYRTYCDWHLSMPARAASVVVPDGLAAVLEGYHRCTRHECSAARLSRLRGAFGFFTVQYAAWPSLQPAHLKARFHAGAASSAINCMQMQNISYDAAFHVVNYKHFGMARSEKAPGMGPRLAIASCNSAVYQCPFSEDIATCVYMRAASRRAVYAPHARAAQRGMATIGYRRRTGARRAAYNDAANAASSKRMLCRSRLYLCRGYYHAMMRANSLCVNTHLH